MCILHIVFCKYVLSICKLMFFALSGARSKEFHSPRHLCCGDVTIKVICNVTNSRGKTFSLLRT